MSSAPEDAASDLAEELHWQVFRITSAIRRREYAGAADGELSLTQCSILYALHLSGRTRLGDLALREGVSAPTMTSAISRLEKLGMVKRRRDLADKRNLWIEATPAGNTARRGAVAEVLNRIRESLSREDMQALIAALGPIERLASAIEIAGTAPPVR